MAIRLNAKKPKQKSAGLASPKNGEIRLLDSSFIIEMPKVDLLGIATLSDFVLKENWEFQYLYLTPKTQKYEINSEGEADSRMFKKKIFGHYPGNEIEIFQFIKKNINKSFVAIYKECDAEYSKIFGSRLNPLFISSIFKDDDLAKKHEITLEQNALDKTPILFYDEGRPIYVEDSEHIKIFDKTTDQTIE